MRPLVKKNWHVSVKLRAAKPAAMTELGLPQELNEEQDEGNAGSQNEIRYQQWRCLYLSYGRK